MLHANKSTFSLNEALSCFLARSGSPAPIFTPLLGSLPRGMNSKSLSGTGQRRSCLPLGASTSSLSKRVSSAMESTFGGACYSSNRVGLSVEIVACRGGFCFSRSFPIIDLVLPF